MFVIVHLSPISSLEEHLQLTPKARNNCLSLLEQPMDSETF